MFMTAPTRVVDGNADVAPVPQPTSLGDRIAARSGMTPRTLFVGALLPVISTIVIVAVILVAPTTEKSTIFLASIVALAAGLSSTAVGVYGGVLVPGLLLLGLD